MKKADFLSYGVQRAQVLAAGAGAAEEGDRENHAADAHQAPRGELQLKFTWECFLLKKSHIFEQLPTPDRLRDALQPLLVQRHPQAECNEGHASDLK